MEELRRLYGESLPTITPSSITDFDVLLGGMSLRSFGSQGQTRTAAVSLKLAEREIFRGDTGEEPVLLLDDVLSELDAGRQDFILNKIMCVYSPSPALKSCCPRV